MPNLGIGIAIQNLALQTPDNDVCTRMTQSRVKTRCITFVGQTSQADTGTIISGVIQGFLVCCDEDRKSDFMGVNGETCWIIVPDHFTQAVFGDTSF
jgi:hypothetical protein